MNSLQNEDESLTATPEKTLTRVQEYFQNLLSKTEQLKESTGSLNYKMAPN
jgi:hypothetical protein